MMHLPFRSARASLLAVPLAWLVGAAACTLDTSGARSEAATGAGGTTSSSGEGGELLGCEVDADCPGFGDACLDVRCEDTVCMSSIRTGEPCAEDAFCNVEGECLGALGSPCGDASECNSDICVDGVCCQRACDGLCEACTAQGACEPVAAAEDPADECMPGVCDGQLGCASGEDIDAFAFGDSGNQRIFAVAVTPTGESIVGGDNDGDLNVDGSPQAADNNRDGWAAKRNADGTPAWVTYFPGQNVEEVTAVGSDADGNAYLCGNFADDVDIDASTVSSVGGRDIFLVKLAAADGAAVWSRTYGSSSDEACHGLAVDPATGDVVIVGEYQATVDFGGMSATSAGNEDAFVVRLAAATGNVVWVESFGAGGLQSARGVAIDTTGDVVVGGIYDDAFMLGASALDPLGGRDGWVAKLAGGDGTLQWSTTFGEDGPDVDLLAVAAGPDGAIAAAGSFTDTVDFGGGDLNAAGNSDGFVVELDGAGQYRRSRRFGSDGDDRVASVAIDITGAVVFGGLIRGAIDFGGATIPPGGDDDAFVAKLSADGLELWARVFGDDAKQQVRAVATNVSRTVVAGGFFEGTYGAVGTTFTATSTDALFLRLLP